MHVAVAVNCVERVNFYMTKLLTATHGTVIVPSRLYEGMRKTVYGKEDNRCE